MKAVEETLEPGQNCSQYVLAGTLRLYVGAFMLHDAWGDGQLQHQGTVYGRVDYLSGRLSLPGPGDVLAADVPGAFAGPRYAKYCTPVDL